METTNTMTELLEAATALFTWVTTNLATIINTVASNPLLLMGFLTSLVGLVIGVVRRLMNLS